jgi:DNA modification methylase
VVVWDKTNGAPQMQSNVLTNAFEFLFVFSSQRGATRSIPFADFHGTKKNVIAIDPRGKNDFADVHRAVMPVELVEWAIDLCSKAVCFVDPFGGTGTTMIACERKGKRAGLIEMDPRYCDVIIRRWQDYTGRQATLESTGETFDQVAARRAA